MKAVSLLRAPSSPGSQQASKPLAQLGRLGSRSQLASSSLPNEWSLVLKFGTGRGLRGSPAAKQAFEKGV
jgi:hypothetical protein